MQKKLVERVDVAESKGLIVKRLGAEKSRRYFYYLNWLLSQRFSGRENLPLHNQLVRATLKNAGTAKFPPVGEEGLTRIVSEAGMSAVAWSNGVASPRKVQVRFRSDNYHDWKLRNRLNVTENETDKEKLAQQPLRSQCLSRSVEELVSLYIKDKGGVQSGRLNYSPIRPPLGIQSRKTSPDVDPHFSFSSNGESSETQMLRIRMEQIAAVQDLGGVSLECANLLNRMSSSVSIHQKRLRVEGKYLNGLLPNNQLQVAASGSNGGVITMCEERPRCSISLLDFKVAAEHNPQQLGEDWPSNLEKISMYFFEEE
uniref:Uncharacterized protein n=1 Tax=Kalanchoe fedtschenkoi TaxID=63787 RepID=A0A7N0U7F9_KALFE